jgi:hypothetical protein
MVVVAGNSVTASRDNERVILTCYDGLEPALVKGREDPPLGWFSGGFDARKPAHTAVFAGEIHGNAVLRTSVSIKRG